MSKPQHIESNPDYSHAAPFESGFLPVGTIHKLHYEQYGKKDGKPVIFLHGGPGGHTTAENTVFFNPAYYRVVLLDQRGAGKSTPHAELRENTSQHLVADIEAIRIHLQIPTWHLVFGGSWGSTLALLYAQTHPSAVGSLVLRGIFTIRKAEMEWTAGGAALFFPDHYEPFVNHIPEAERGDLLAAYHARLTSEDRATRVAAARAWNLWELSTSSLLVDNEGNLEKADNEKWSLAHARIETQCFRHGAWLEEGQLLKKENIDHIREIPTTIIQGRYDLVCPPQSAYDLHKAWPEATFCWIPDAGHGAKESGTHQKLVEVCDQYAQL